MQIYDTKLVTIQLKRIRNEILDLKVEHTNIDFSGLNDKLDFLEDLLHLYDARDIQVINIKKGLMPGKVVNMSLAARTRGGGRVTLPNDIKLEDLTYTKARDLVGDKFEPMPLAGFFFKKGKFGKEVTLVVNRNGELLGVNIPNWYIKTFEDLTDEEVKEILDGKQALESVEAFETQGGNTSYRVNFIDVEQGGVIL